VDRIGGEQSIRSRVTIVEGDLDEAMCGISESEIERLKGVVDVVVNLAGLVEFDPPLNESIEPNVYGTQHVIDLAQGLGARLVHISTCYVAGKKNGTFPKTLRSTVTFPCVMPRPTGTSPLPKS
jgi:long-chain acyl-CoA synthetase